MRPAFLFLLAMMAAGLSGPALAQFSSPSGVQPLDRILPDVRRSYPGQFYDADGPVTEPDGSVHYHLKWMTPDGRIEWLDTDARTGRVLGSTPGHDAFDGPGIRRRFVPAPSFPMPPPLEAGRPRGGFEGFGGFGHGGGRHGR